MLARALRLGLIVLALPCVAPMAALAQVSPQTLADVRAELDQLAADFNALKSELVASGNTASIGGGDALQRMDAIEAELAQLTARTEQVELKLNRVVADGTNRIGDIEYRLCEATAGCDPLNMPATAPLGGDTTATATPTPGFSAEATGGPELAIGEQADFDRAKEVLGQGDFRGAEALFATFTQSYPGGPLTQEAHYLRGEALRQLGETANAARAYLEAYSGNPQGALAPDALLKLGESLGDLGQTPEACVTLGEVATQYPGTTAATQAPIAMQGLGVSVEAGFDWPKDLGESLAAPAVVAVSGGSDSMALLHMVAEIASRTGRAVCALTVDHRLRPEAAAEAAFVGRACKALGVPHEVLVWDHGAIVGNLMDAARDARYRMMTDWARGRGIGFVLLGHTADDQAETFLMGLARSAGLDGLTGMRPHWQQGGVTFLRPLLGLSRAALRSYLQGKGQVWIDDPTNENDRYTRVKARRALKALKPLGVTVDRLSQVIHNLAMVQGVVRDAVARAAREVVTETAGALILDRSALGPCGPEVERRLLIAMVRWIGGAGHPPREAQVAALGRALAEGRDATLGGCRFRQKGGLVTVTREARAAGGAVSPGTLWDGRWEVQAASGEVRGEIRALGADGLRQCGDWRASGLPRQVLEVTPGVWQGDRLLAAPCAGFGTIAATTRPGFHAFLLSH